MASLNNTGIDELIKNLERLDKDVRPVMKMALYEGAKVYADQLKSEIQSLEVDEDWAHKKDPRVTVTSVEKDGLVNGMGISKFRSNLNEVSTSVGFNGRNADGKSNQRIAMSINSGTSIRKKDPFIQRANRKAKAKALQAIQEKFEDVIGKILGS